MLSQCKIHIVIVYMYESLWHCHRCLIVIIYGRKIGAGDLITCGLSFGVKSVVGSKFQLPRTESVVTYSFQECVNL